GARTHNAHTGRQVHRGKPARRPVGAAASGARRHSACQLRGRGTANERTARFPAVVLLRTSRGRHATGDDASCSVARAAEGTGSTRRVGPGGGASRLQRGAGGGFELRGGRLLAGSGGALDRGFSPQRAARTCLASRCTVGRPAGERATSGTRTRASRVRLLR